MKKFLSMLLCVLMVVSLFTVSAQAVKEENEWKKYPLILVPGYTATNLYKLDENGNQVMVWGDILGIIGDGLNGESVGLLEQLAKSLKENDSSYFAKRVGEGFNRIFADLA